MGDFNPALGHHGHQVAVAQPIRDVPANAQLDDFGRVATPALNGVAGSGSGHGGSLAKGPEC